MLYLTEIIRNLEEEYHVQFRGGSRCGIEILSCQIVSTKAINKVEFPSCLYISEGKRPEGISAESPCLVTGVNRDLKMENMYYCREKLELQEVFQSIQRMIYFHIKLLEDKEKLLKAVQNGAGGEIIIKNAARHLGNPVYLCNMGLRIMYQYPDEMDTRMIGDESGGRYIVNIESVKDDRLIQRIQNSIIPFLQVSPHFEYRMLIAPVRIRDISMGFLFVKETQKVFSQDDIDYLSMLADIFAIELQKKPNITMSQTQQQEAFIEDLILERIQQEEILREKLQLMGLSFGKYMWFGIIPLNREFRQIHIRTYIEGMRRILPKSIIIYQNFSIIILAGCDVRDHFRKESYWEQLEAFLNDYHFLMSVSYGFDMLSHAGDYFRQAEYMLEEVRETDSNMHVLYPDMNFAVLLFKELRNQGKAEAYIHPDLKTLDEYDRMNHTEYIKTLKAYLHCGRNAKKAADYLNIHKSTFHFRMAKIGEVIDFQMTDSKKMFYYELGFALKKTLGH